MDHMVPKLLVGTDEQGSNHNEYISKVQQRNILKFC